MQPSTRLGAWFSVFAVANASKVAEAGTAAWSLLCPFVLSPSDWLGAATGPPVVPPVAASPPSAPPRVALFWVTASSCGSAAATFFWV